MPGTGLGLSALARSPQRRLPTPRRLLRLRSDTALAERFAAGDETAFAVLYERHRASVLAVCIGVLGSRDDAEDAAQEAFASLAGALRGRPPRELRPWLARVARNAAIDFARRRRVDTSVEAELNERHALANSSDAAANTRDAELETVIAGLRELPESQRTALVMRELAGHSYQEIAGLLETDEEAVRGLIARARIGLRNYREAAELPCATVRAALAAEGDGRRRPKEVRRHLRTCPSCRGYRRSLRADVRALRGIVPVQSGVFAGGTAVVGGLATKSLLVGTAMTQVTAACVMSVCAVGGMVLLYPRDRTESAAPAVHHADRASRTRADGGGASIGSNTDGSTSQTSGSAGSAWQLDWSAAAANPAGGIGRPSTLAHLVFARYGAGWRGGVGDIGEGPSQQVGAGGGGPGNGQAVSTGSRGGGGSSGQGSVTGSAAPAGSAGTGTAGSVGPSGAGSTVATQGAAGGNRDSGSGSSSRAGASQSGGSGSSSANAGPSSTGNGSASASGGSGGGGSAGSGASGQAGSGGGPTGSAGGQSGSAGGQSGATSGQGGATGGQGGSTGGQSSSLGGQTSSAAGQSDAAPSGSPGG